eukprot:COSAG06_NODE_51747_length_310_cov_0.734597_1_plen_49_part_01
MRAVFCSLCTVPAHPARVSVGRRADRVSHSEDGSIGRWLAVVALESTGR